jgi:hypothetical protein
MVTGHNERILGRNRTVVERTDDLFHWYCRVHSLTDGPSNRQNLSTSDVAPMCEYNIHICQLQTPEAFLRAFDDAKK